MKVYPQVVENLEQKEQLKQYSPFLKKLLINRSIFTDVEAGIFLDPNFERDTHDPFLLKDIEKAVERILTAVQKGEKIMIFSDFDADGIPAAVILSDFFKKIGHENFSVSIPHRNTEGFGLNESAINRFIQDEVQLLITLDCGMGDAIHITRLQEAGIDVIVVDHHLPNHAVPKAWAIVNPNQERDTYPNKNLCGAAVTYKLLCALLQKLRTTDYGLQTVPTGWEKWLLDMVGIATLSDMVGLTGENRVLAYYGLLVLRKSRRVGLRKMFEKSGIKQRYLTEDDIVFTITPRINAASRMDEPEIAFRLLSTNDEAEAEILSNHLTHINNARKGLVASMTKEIKHKLELQDSIHPVVVVGNPHWQPGLLGLAAHHIVETYRRPAFVWGRGSAPIIKGSCRSDGSVNLVTLMTNVSDVFVEFGGHMHSGGFSLSVEQVEHLSSRLNASYEEVKVATVISEENESADAELSVEDVTWNMYRDIECLAPFGMGNPKPIFLFKTVTVRQASTFGKENQHVRLVLATPAGGFVSGVKFFVPSDSFLASVVPGDVVDITAAYEKSTFGNKTELRLRIVDIHKSV